MKKSLLPAVFLCIAYLTSAQETRNSSFSKDTFLSEYVSRIWTAANGLKGNSVTDIMQDSTGYMYLGTYDGLVRFDGVEFVTFNRNYDEKYNFVSARAIFEDSKGNLWNGSNDEGLFCIFPDGSVSSYSTDSGLPSNSIRAITEDKDGKIWVGTASGIVYVDTNGNIQKPLGFDELGDSNILVTKLYCDTAGRIWILTPNENSTYVYVNRHFERFSGLKSFGNSIITSVTQDKNTNFWYGVAPHYAVRVSNGEETVYNVGHGEQSGTSVNCIFEDKKGAMWFSLDTGVTIIHDGLYSYFDSKNGLSDDKVSKITQDREGNIWFATDRGGIERLSQSKFKTTTMSTTINAIAEDPGRKVVWLAGDDGLYCLEKNTFIENPLTRMCRNVRIRDVEASKDGTLLVSCYEKLGQIIVSPDNSIRNLTKDNGLPGMKVRVAIKASDGLIYIGTTTGLGIYDERSGKVSTLSKKDGVSNDYIMAIYEDSSGEIWCGTDGGGMFTLKDGKLNKTYSTADGLIGNVIFKIYELTEGDFWITTGTGISRLNLASGEITNYNSRNGLGADGVFQAIPDYTRTVWMTSNSGIFCATMDEMDAIASGQTIKINSKFFGQSDGLISGGVTSTSKSMKDSLGRIWFTLIDGFAIYDPLNVTANKTAPLVKIQEYTVDNEKYVWRGEKVTLEPDTKRIEIKFTGLSFVSSEQTQFKSRLQGFENDYSLWSTSRSVSYTNLRHGKYRFSVIAANSDGVESQNLQEIEIIKKPFFYETIWFWLSVAAVVIGAVYLAIHHKFSRMKKYQIQLEKAVQDRTKDLVAEEEKTTHLLLNVLPADIAEELKDNPDKTVAKKYMHASVLFSDIIDFTRMSDTLSAEEIVRLLNELTTRFDERAKREGVEKIKTIGDGYMAATGLVENADDESVIRLVRFARGILDDVRDFNRSSQIKVQVRIGINTGNLVAGVIGKSKFIYDLWGDTVNVACRMQESGAPKKIHVTESTYQATKDSFSYERLPDTQIKGKGLMTTYQTE